MKAINSRNAENIINAVNAKPLDLNRIMQAAKMLASSNLREQALALSKTVVNHNPRSIEGWRAIQALTTSGSNDFKIAEEKIKSTIELAENIIEQGKKVIIFTNFTDTLQQIYNHFGKSAVYLDGSCSKPHRQKAVDDFQENEKIKVFVGNLKAAGVGITLTAAEAVIMNDLSFVPAEHAQAEDRSHRIGQKN